MRMSRSRMPGALNDALGRAVGVDPNVASAMRGFYGEAAYRVLSGHVLGDVGVFTRYENFDTQYRMPDGYLPLKEFDRDAFVIGGNVLARSRHRDQSGLLDRQEPELGHRRSQLVQSRSWMVVLMTRIFTRFDIAVTVMGLARRIWRRGHRRTAAAAPGGRDFGRTVQLHAVGVQGEGRRSLWRSGCAVTIRITASGS